MTGRRRWAFAALAAALATVVVAAVRFPAGFAVPICLVLAVAAVAYAVRRRGRARTAGLALAALLVVGAIAIVIAEGRVLEGLLVFAGVAATLAAARLAFRAHVEWPRAARPAHPVLFYNPLSGGGKARRFRLADEARARGIEPIELRRGDDLEQLVRDAIARGADALAMAGGDGSQATVAWIASELDLPYACIPSGTRNHFALDLGVDRDDVVGALDAFVAGGERRVDLAEVNGRVFVNNVSLGLYAEAVQRPGYREAKLHTLLETVPDTFGPSAEDPNLVWDGPGGPESAAAILVSNNPYRLGRAIGSGTRPRLDRGVLGVAVLAPVETIDNGSVRHKLHLEQWTTSKFTMNAHSQVAAGIDGEAMQLESPIRFRIRPRALRVRIAPGHPGASPSALEPDHPRQMIGALVRLATHGAPSDRSGR
jgi:diacylglycerol kinase family enzyme